MAVLASGHKLVKCGDGGGSGGEFIVRHDETLSGDGTLSSLLGVVDAGDTEVNEFVYNNSGDIINVNDVVQSNSANWGQGGNPEVESYVTSNSATINQTVSTYQLNSGNYVPLNSAFVSTAQQGNYLFSANYNMLGNTHQLSSVYIPNPDVGQVTSVHTVKTNQNGFNHTYKDSRHSYTVTTEIGDVGVIAARTDDSAGYVVGFDAPLNDSIYTQWFPSGCVYHSKNMTADNIGLYEDVAFDSHSLLWYSGNNPSQDVYNTISASATWAQIINLTAQGGATYDYTDNNLISAIDASALYATSAISAVHLNQNGTMGVNILQSGAGNFYYMPAISPFGKPRGIFSPLQYATGACLAMSSESFAAYFKGNEWYVSNSGIGQMLRGEVHASRGVHISGATTVGYGFNLGITNVSGVNSTGSWKYGVAEDTALRSVSSKLDTSAFTLSALNDASANNIVLTASLPATPDANTLYLIPES